MKKNSLLPETYTAYYLGQRKMISGRDGEWRTTENISEQVGHVDLDCVKP